MSGKWRRRAAADIILIVSGVLIVFVIPEFAFIPTGCIFNKITGFYCAGCGISRGVHALMRGNIYAAMHQNFLLVTVFPLSAVWLTLRYFILKHSGNIKKYDKGIIIFFMIFVLVFTLLRNLQFHHFDFLRPV
ncbi:MAG TPA: DUF2752 domain-containing protein [Spirochaetota bacterium]|nr:DUF2752 domain-containing protein [Spirochaetota bacterium]